MPGPLGFTGVDWDARTSEQLATDLTNGPGPGPLVEAGLAWAAVAAEIGEAGIEYAAVLARLGLHWESAQSSQAFETLTRLGPWFADTAAAAAANAVRAETQAAAVTVARLNMPNLAEVGIVEELSEIATKATVVAPIMAGAAAEAERAVQHQRMRAARVMQTYEHATEPVAQRWESARPAPQLVSGDPLAAEQAAARAAAAPSPQPQTSHPTTPVMTAIPAMVTPAVEKVRYTPTVLASGQAPTSIATSPTTGATTSGTPGMPPPLAPGLAATADRTATVRAGFDAGDADTADAEDAGAADSGMPVTWEEIATTDQPVARFAPSADPEDGSGQSRLDPRYLSETLLLGDRGGRT